MAERRSNFTLHVVGWQTKRDIYFYSSSGIDINNNSGSILVNRCSPKLCLPQSVVVVCVFELLISQSLLADALLIFFEKESGLQPLSSTNPEPGSFRGQLLTVGLN